MVDYITLREGQEMNNDKTELEQLEAEYKQAEEDHRTFRLDHPGAIFNSGRMDRLAVKISLLRQRLENAGDI